MARIQPVDNTSDAGPSYDSAFISEVQSSSIKDNQEQMYPTHTKIINSTIGDDQIDSNIIFDEPNGNVNSGSVEKDTHVLGLYALEQLARNAYKEAEKQQLFAQKVQQQNTTLTSQLDLHKESVRRYHSRSRKQRDKLDLAVTDYKQKNKKLQKTHLILKRQMSKNEDRYHETILDLEAKLKKNVDPILKLGNSLQGMFMLGPKPFLNNLEIPLDVRDTENILDDASKSQNKMKEKMNDPIAVAKKHRNGALRSWGHDDLTSVCWALNKLIVDIDRVVPVYVRKNKQTDKTSATVISNKENVIDVNVANASKAKTLLCVSCMQNVLIPCHDKCLANYKLNVHSTARRAFSTNFRTPKSSDTTYVVLKTRFSEKLAQSKSLDTTSVVSKPKIDVGSISKAKHKVSSASKTKKRNLRDNSLSIYMQNKIRTSRIWQKWFESQPNVVWSPVNTTLIVHNKRSTVKPSGSVKKWVVKLPTCPCVGSSCVAGSPDRSVDC
ncbi:hypothetical protein Tco_0046926 [Tanacetum coccineum]